MDRSVLIEAIRDSPLGCSPTSSCPAELFEVYHSTLTEIADRLVPAHSTQSRICPLSPWFDAECRSIRRNCRRLENKYRRTKDVVHRLEWVESVRNKHKVFRDKENSYWARKIVEEKGSHQSCGSHCRPYFAATGMRTGHPLHQSTRRRIS